MYFRNLKQPGENSDIVIEAVGDKPSREAGIFLINHALGVTSSRSRMSREANSTLWVICTHAADFSLLFAATILGQMFRTTGGRESWRKMPRELSEIRKITWAPV